MSERVVILLAHGSPQPQWAAPARELRDRIAAQRPSQRVHLAFLPPATPDLDHTIREEIAAGARDFDVLALLLSGGGKHMQRDVPQMLEQLREEFPGVELRLHRDALGATPEAIAAMAVAAERILK